MTGDYEFREILGTGASGRVFRAWDLRLHREVALKVFDAPQSLAVEVRERLLNEARIQASLGENHSIVAIHDVIRTDDGQPALVMELVEGESLSERIKRDAPFDYPEVIRVFRAILETVAFAHSKRVCHRDLKPANILIRSDGEVKVTDFGISARLREGSEEPLTETLRGTPAFMAPEQFETRGLADPRSDLYAAGAILYQMSTGKLPIRAWDLFSAARNHATVPPTPPSEIRSGFPGALEDVILKLLEKKPDDRYQTAQETLEALRSFQGDTVHAGDSPAGRSAHASPAQPPRRPLRWLLASSLLILACAWVAWMTLGRPAARTPEGTLHSSTGQASSLLTNPDLMLVRSMGIQAHTGFASFVRFVGDSHRVATMGIDQSVAVWDSDTGLEVARLRQTNHNLVSMDVHSASGLGVCGTGNGKVLIWNVEAGELVRVIKIHEAAILEVELSDDGARLATVSLDESAAITDLATQETLYSVKTAPHVPRAMEWTDPDQIVIGFLDGSIMVWNPQTGKTTAPVAVHTGRLTEIRKGGIPDLYVTTGDGPFVCLWNAREAMCEQDLHVGEFAYSVAMASLSHAVFCGFKSGEVALVPISYEAPLKMKNAHEGYCRSVDISSDGKRAASVGDDGKLVLWDLP